MSQIYAPSSLLRGVRSMLMRAISGASGENLLGRVAMLEPSDGRSEIYTWLGEAPRMERVEEDAEIQYRGMSDTRYELINQLWKTGIIIKRTDLDDDQTGAIQRRINQAASVAQQHINRLIIQALVDGTTTAGYDGANFFADAHPARGQLTAAQDNLLAGSGTTVANVHDDIMTAIETILSFRAENGEPFDEMGNRFAVVFPLQLLGQMKTAIGAEQISSTNNVQFAGFSVDLIPSARLAAVDANDFYVLNVSNASDLPIVVQQRDALEVIAQTTGDDAFDREHYKYQLRWRGVPGYAHWQRAAKVVNT